MQIPEDYYCNLKNPPLRRLTDHLADSLDRCYYPYCTRNSFIFNGMAIQVYGIPNCGTCKKAFQWLDQQGIAYEFINTKENPPSRDTISRWVKALGSKPMRNTSGQAYRALGEERNTWTDDQWIEAFSQDAMLLKRPLFVKEGEAVLVGFRAQDAAIREKLGV